MDDPFIRNYIEDLLRNIRTQVLIKLIKPYTTIRIPFVSKVPLPFSLSYLRLVLQYKGMQRKKSSLLASYTAARCSMQAIRVWFSARAWP